MSLEMTSVSYTGERGGYEISVVPGLILDEACWAALKREKKVFYALIRHDLLMSPGLWCDDPIETLAFAGKRADGVTEEAWKILCGNPRLALGGRLMDWKLCAAEFYSSEYWLHFYHIYRDAIQSVRLCKGYRADGVLLPDGSDCATELSEGHDLLDKFVIKHIDGREATVVRSAQGDTVVEERSAARMAALRTITLDPDGEKKVQEHNVLMWAQED